MASTVTSLNETQTNYKRNVSLVDIFLKFVSKIYSFRKKTNLNTLQHFVHFQLLLSRAACTFGMLTREEEEERSHRQNNTRHKKFTKRHINLKEEGRGKKWKEASDRKRR